jgi:hypothetical protein
VRPRRLGLAAVLLCAVVLASAVAAIVQSNPSVGAQAQDCVAFTIDARKPWQRERVVAPGTPAKIAANGFWGGPTFAGGRALISVETAKIRLRGGPFYTTFYGRAATGCRSGYLATGDQEPPEGEIVISSDRRSSWLSRTTLRIVNGKNGVNVKRPFWPRFRMKLASGEQATVVPARGRPAGLGGFRGFVIILPTTLVHVGGGAFAEGEVSLSTPEIRKLAETIARVPVR